MRSALYRLLQGIFHMKAIVLLVMLLGWLNQAYADVEFERIDSFSAYIEREKLGESAGLAQREYNSQYVNVDVILKSEISPGRFDLVYNVFTVLGIEKTKIGYSVFIGADDGVVLNAYVASEAAKNLTDINVGSRINIKALHLYNFSRGPRLVILSVGLLDD